MSGWEVDWDWRVALSDRTVDRVGSLVRDVGLGVIPNSSILNDLI